jgi:hypothetical protein
VSGGFPFSRLAGEGGAQRRMRAVLHAEPRCGCAQLRADGASRTALTISLSMKAKRLCTLWLACSVAVTVAPTAKALDACAIKVPSSQQTAYALAGRDWRREFALDRPQTQSTQQEVYRWVQSRAELGDAKAEWVIAEELLRDRGRDHCGMRDPGEWIEIEGWLKRSASQGYVPARLDLARLYWVRPPGLGSPESKGLELFSGAAATDDLASQVYMGLAYECGRGVPKDLTEARKRFALAATHNPFLSNAQMQLQPPLEPTAALAWSVAIKGAARVRQFPDTSMSPSDGACLGAW